MRKVTGFRVFCLAACLIAVFACLGQPSGRGAKVLVVVRDGSENLEAMILDELNTMLSALKGAGAVVTVATGSGEPVAIGKASFSPDLKLEAVRVADYDGLIIPCMASSVRTEQVVAIVRDAASAGIPIAAGDGAIFNLRDAGLLQGRRYALDPMFEGSLNEGTSAGRGVVQDGLLITAGSCPNDSAEKNRVDSTKDLTAKFIRAVRERLQKLTSGGGEA